MARQVLVLSFLLFLGACGGKPTPQPVVTTKPCQQDNPVDRYNCLIVTATLEHNRQEQQCIDTYIEPVRLQVCKDEAMLKWKQKYDAAEKLRK